MQGKAKVRIAAPPDRVWAMVSDVTRMGEWSPETVHAEWVDGWSGPVPGARFRGRNKRGFLTWSTTATVTSAEPGKTFAFVIDSGGTAWRYELAAVDGGTDLTESYEVHEGQRLAGLLYTLFRRKPRLDAGIVTTLERIKAAAESGTPRQAC